MPESPVYRGTAYTRVFQSRLVSSEATAHGRAEFLNITKEAANFQGASQTMDATWHLKALVTMVLYMNVFVSSRSFFIQTFVMALLQLFYLCILRYMRILAIRCSVMHVHRMLEKWRNSFRPNHMFPNFHEAIKYKQLNPDCHPAA